MADQTAAAHSGAEARQRLEQYFTFPQSRAHFLRHAKGRPQHAQRLVGKSSLRRILGMALPVHRLAAPVEEAAVPFQSEAIDNPEHMDCRLRRPLDFRVELAPAFLGRLPIIIKKACRVEYKPDIASGRSEQCRAFQTCLVEQVDRRRRRAAVDNDLLEAVCGSQCSRFCRLSLHAQLLDALPARG